MMSDSGGGGSYEGGLGRRLQSELKAGEESLSEVGYLSTFRISTVVSEEGWFERSLTLVVAAAAPLGCPHCCRI